METGGPSASSGGPVSGLYRGPASTASTPLSNPYAPPFPSVNAAVNPYSSGIGPGTATSVVYGANPTAYMPIGGASQVDSTIGAAQAAPMTSGQAASSNPAPPASELVLLGGLGLLLLLVL